MGIVDRAINVIATWARKPSPGDDDVLEQLWADSGQAVPFQPDGQRQLIDALKREFTKLPKLDIQLIPSDLDPAGQIKTVNDLAVAVSRMPSP